MRRQSFCAPFHIGKAYADPHALMVQVVNPTAGVFAGDDLRLQIVVEPGARLHIGTPSANRIHQMHAGSARLRQSFQVAAGGWLEVNPATLIPQHGSRYRQTVNLELERGAELFFVESLAPGRVARGEVFQYHEIDWELNLTIAGELILRECFRLRPIQGRLPVLERAFPGSYFASILLVTERIEDTASCWSQVRGLANDDVLLGATRICRGGWVIRVLSRDSHAQSQVLIRLRQILGDHLEPLQAEMRNGR